MNKENGFCDAKLLVFHITFLHRFKYLIESWNSGLWDLNVLFFRSRIFQTLKTFKSII